MLVDPKKSFPWVSTSLLALQTFGKKKKSSQSILRLPLDFLFQRNGHGIFLTIHKADPAGVFKPLMLQYTCFSVQILIFGFFPISFIHYLVNCHLLVNCYNAINATQGSSCHAHILYKNDRRSSGGTLWQKKTWLNLFWASISINQIQSE